jgi:hypothetical protein
MQEAIINNPDCLAISGVFLAEPVGNGALIVPGFS